MRHPDPEELQRLVDGELGHRQTPSVSKHVSDCAECSEAVRRIRATGDLLRLAFDQIAEDAPLEGFADRVMESLAKQERKPLPLRERIATWAGEFFRYRQKLWAPSLALASAAAVALVALLVLRGDPPLANQQPAGSTVISVSFGNTVNGHVFELEDKDGTTTSVIWVDESKTASNESNTEAGRDLFWWRTIGTKRT